MTSRPAQTKKIQAIQRACLARNGGVSWRTAGCPVENRNVDTLPGLKARDSIPGSTCNAGLRQTNSQSTGVFRLRVSLGDDPQTFGSYVLGRVAVPEVVRSTPTTSTPARRAKGRRSDSRMRNRWKEPVYLNKVFAVPLGLVLCGFLFLELGNLSSALEEIDIDAPEIGQRLLQHLRIEVVEPQFRLLELGELGR